MQIEYTRPWLTPEQLEAIFNDARYGLIEASTKSGKTTGCMVWLTEQAMQCKRGQNVWWVAPIFSQAEIVFNRLRMALPRSLYESNATKLTITLPNGVTIWFKSADKPDSLYGDDVYAAVIDEASRVKEEAWHAVRSTLTATRGKLRIIGNVKGRKNWFYGLCRKAESGERDMSYRKITAHDAVSAGILEAAEIEDAKSKLPDHVFRELYLAEPADDGGNPFGLAAIARCIKPLSAKKPKWWGWDLAKSVDWTVGVGLDEDGNVCRVVRFQKPWQETMDTIVAQTGCVYALVDSSGVGDPIVEDLQRRGGNYEGFKFSQSSKQMLMEGLALAIQQEQIGYPEGVIVTELEEFEYTYSKTGVKYSAPAGMHDDCVMALALANKARGAVVNEFRIRRLG